MKTIKLLVEMSFEVKDRVTPEDVCEAVSNSLCGAGYGLTQYGGPPNDKNDVVADNHKLRFILNDEFWGSSMK